MTIFLAGVIAFIIGFLLHGPVLGKLWMRLAGIVPTGNEKFKDMIPQMIWNLVANFVTAYALSLLVLLSAGSAFMTESGVVNGMIVAFIVWFGFNVTSTSMEVIWMKKSFKLWLFDVFASLVVMLAMGIVVGW